VTIPLEQRITRTAHHEAGHIVVAAVQNLKLRPEGLSVDERGEGLACYCKEPGNSDSMRECVIIATFAGLNSEARFCNELGLPVPEEMQRIFSQDSKEARSNISSLSYLSVERTAFQIEAELQAKSEAIISLHWSAILSVGAALLNRNWESLRTLKSGGVWSQSEKAKYLAGDELAATLRQVGIDAEFAETC
jgi:hypothetical protein